MKPNVRIGKQLTELAVVWRELYGIDHSLPRMQAIKQVAERRKAALQRVEGAGC